MSELNIKSISGNGHTIGNGNAVHNAFTFSFREGQRVLTRDDYYHLLFELWGLGRISVPDYLEEKYEQHIGKNPHFAELLYRDIHKIMDGVLRPEEDGDIAIENGDLVIENGAIKRRGHTNNFFDAMTWLDRKLKNLWADDMNWNLDDPIAAYTKKIEDFEKHSLNGGEDSPAVVLRLKELNEQLKTERAAYDVPNPNAKGKTVNVPMEVQHTNPPKAFISYAWDDDTKARVKVFATQLRRDGIDARIDQWQLMPGDQIEGRFCFQGGFKHGLNKIDRTVACPSNMSMIGPLIFKA